MANEIDRLLGNQAGSLNPVDQALEDQSFKVKSSMAAAEQGPEPDKYAEIIRIANEANVPVDIAERNLPEVTRRANANRNQVDAMIAKNPALTAWLENKSHANLAKDEIQALKDIENSVSDFSTMSQAYAAINSGVSSVYSNVAKVPALAYDIAALPQNALYEAMGSERRVQAPDWLRNNVIANRYKKASEEFAAGAPDLSGDVFDLISEGDISGAAKTAFLQLANNAPNQVAMIAASMAAGPAVGLGFAGVTSAAGESDRLATEGVDPLLAAPTAIAMGSIEASFERLGTLAVVEKWQGALTKKFGKETAGAFMKRVGMMLAGNSVQEGAEEFGTSVSQDVLGATTKTNEQSMEVGDVLKRGFNAGVIGGLSSSTTTLPTVLAATAARNADMQSAKRASDFFISLGNASEVTKLKQRSPEAQGALFKGIAENTGVTDVYISVEGMETFLQKSGDPIEVATKLGFLDIYTHAKENGTDLKIPLQDMATKIVGTEGWQALQGDIKYSPDALSMNEVIAENERANGELQAESDAVRATLVNKIDLTGATTDEDLLGKFQSQQQAQRFIDYSTKRLADNRQTMAPEEYSYMESQTNRVKGLLSQLPDQPNKGEQTRRRNESLSTVRANLEAELIAAGVSPREAKTQALITSEGAGALADAAGVSPEELQARYPLRVRGNQGMTAGDLAAAMPTQPVDADGNKIYDADITASLRASIERGEAGERLTKSNEAGEVTGMVAQESSFPEFFKNKGYTKKETLKIIDKQLAGEKLTEKQQAVFDDLYSGAFEATQRREFFQSNEQANPFFFKSTQVIEQKMGNSATPDQVRGILKEMKPEEIKWLKVEEFLQGKTKVSKAELLDHMAANEIQLEEITKTDDTQYSKYVLPGGENYREVLFQLPIREQPEITELPDSYKVTEEKSKLQFGDMPSESSWFVHDETGHNVGVGLTREKAVANALKRLNNRPPKDTYGSSHFDERNILAHTRIDERVDTDGNKILFIQEVQSDWHQDGRKKGYSSDVKDLPEGHVFFENKEAKSDRQKWFVIDTTEQSENKFGGAIAGLGETKEAALENFNKVTNKTVPDAPLRKTWHEFVLKRMVRYAAENGFDKIAWTTGEQQEQRYWGDESVAPAVARWNEVTEPESVRELGDNIFGREMATAMSLQVVDGGMLTALEHDQIREAVIKLLSVDVVNILSSANTTPEQLFSNPQVVFSGLPLDSRNSVAINAIGAIRQAYASLRAELSNLSETRGEKLLGTTLSASDLNSREIATLLDPERIFHLGTNRGEAGRTPAGPITESLLGQKTGVAGSKLGSTKLAELLNFHNQLVQGNKGIVQQVFQPGSGEGMKGFYDKILVDAANKLFKKSGAKVSASNVLLDDSALPSFDVSARDGKWYLLEGSMVSGIFTSEAEANEALAKAQPSNTETVHSLEITPELKKEALEQGFSFFQDTQGKIDLIPNGSTFDSIITLFKSKNQSTFAHESAHYLFNVMGDLSEIDTTSKRLKDDFKALLEFVGVESRGELKDVHQEKIARAFEAYLMEGKAPNQKLRRAFSQFKTWMLAIYKNIQGLEVAAGFNIELTPEVRSIFDRMLMSEEQISEAEAKMNYQPMFALSGMSEAQSQKYVNALADARIAADDQIRSELMEYEVRKQKSFYKEEREKLEAEITGLVNDMPVYRAHEDIAKNGAPKLLRSSVVSAYGEDVAKTFPRGMFSADGVSVDLVFESYGFESAKDMVDQLSGFTPKKQYIQTQVDAGMDEVYPDRMAMPEITQDAVLAYHNENRDRVYRLEMDYILENAKGLPKDVIRRLSKATPSDAALKTQAAKVIGNQVISTIKPVLYSRAEAKWNRDAADKLNAGDMLGALESKRKAALNNYLYKAAKDAQSQITEDIAKYKKIFKKDADLSKSRDVDMVDGARAILVSYGLGPKSATFDDPMSYINKLKRYDEDTYQVVASIIEPALNNPQSFRNISFSDYKDMSNAVLALWDYSKESKDIMIEGKRVDFNEALEVGMEAFAEVNKDKKAIGLDRAVNDRERRGIKFLNFMSTYRKIQHWAYAFDRGNQNGFMTKYIVRPVLDGQTKFRVEQINLHKELAEIGKTIDKDTTTKIQGTEIGYEFSNKQELLHAIMHTGNASNMQKLLLGRQNSDGVAWGTQNEDGTLDRSKWDAMIARMVGDGTLTKQDFDTVQQLWNLAESLKPAAQKAHKRMYGFYFNEITAEEFSVTFPDGTVSTYAGGYAPAIVDRMLNRDANIREISKEDSFNSSNMMPTTGSGFTKSRVEYNAPLELNLSRLTSHFDKVLRFTYIEPAVKDVNRFLKNKDFQNQMQLVDPTAIDTMLVPWLSRVATQKMVSDSENKSLDQAANFVRQRVSAQIMAFNVANWFQNFTGSFNALIRLDGSHVAGAYREYMKNPAAFGAMAQEKSDYMKTRMSDSVRMISKEYQDVINPQTKIQKVSEAANKFSFFGEKISNGIVETVTWGAAYRQAVAKGQSESEALKFADDTVRQTIGDMSVAGSSTIETGSPFSRLFTMLSSFFFNSGNLLLTEVSIAKQMGWSGGGGKRAANAYIMGLMAPAVASAIIMRIFAGQGLDADDDGEIVDDLTDIFFVSQAKFLLAMVPFGSVPSAVLNRFNDKIYDDRINISPAVSVTDSALGTVNTVAKMWQGEDLKKTDINAVLLAAGLITGLPSPVVSRPLGYQLDKNSGKANPTGPVDAARGYITGKPGTN